MGYFGKALKHFKQSFHVYTYYLGEGNLQTAKSAFQAASILDQIGHYKEAYWYSSKAVQTFADHKDYGERSCITLTAKWQKLSLAHSLRIGLNANKRQTLTNTTASLAQESSKEVK